MTPLRVSLMALAVPVACPRDTLLNSDARVRCGVHPVTRLVEGPCAGRARLRSVDLTAACRSGDPEQLVSPRLLEAGAALRLHDRASGRSLQR